MSSATVFSDSRLRWQVLQEVARKNHIQAVVGQGPVLGTVLQKQFHVVVESNRRIGVHVHGKLFPRADIVAELSPATTEIQQDRTAVDIGLEEIVTEYAPQCVPIVRSPGKSLAILLLQDIRLVLLASH
ncbi:MAG: hypothetical protein R3E50_01260 [Halioglobus sp.]